MGGGRRVEPSTGVGPGTTGVSASGAVSSTVGCSSAAPTGSSACCFFLRRENRDGSSRFGASSRFSGSLAMSRIVPRMTPRYVVIATAMNTSSVTDVPCTYLPRDSRLFEVRKGTPCRTIATTALHTLVRDLDLAVRRSLPGQETVDAVCEALRPSLTLPDLLEPAQRVGDPAAYRQHLLHVAPDGAFSLVALVWLPGQATPVHDHLTGASWASTRGRSTRRATD